MKYLITILIVFTCVVPRMEGKPKGHLKNNCGISFDPLTNESSPIVGKECYIFYNMVSISRLNNSDTLIATFHEKTIAKGLTTGVIVWKDSSEYEGAKKQCRSLDKKIWGIII